ncbi:MAG: hypothetical protein ABEL76_12825 [Bradymonadaceae bacterium]
MGGADWRYVAYLERLSAPSPAPFTPGEGSITGRVRDLRDNYHRIDSLSQGDILELSVDTFQDGVERGELQLWRNDETLARRLPAGEGLETAAIAPVGSSGSFTLLVDAQRLTGNRDRFKISASKRTDVPDLGTVGEEGTTASPRTTSGTEIDYYRLTLPAGRVLEVAQKNKEKRTASVQVVSAAGEVLARANQLDDLRTDGDRLYYYARTKRSLMVKVLSPAGAFLRDLELTVRTITPTDLGKTRPGETVTGDLTGKLSTGESGFHRFELATKAEVDVVATPSKDAGLELILYDDRFDVLGRDRPSSGDQSTTGETLEAGAYIVRGAATKTLSKPAYGVRLEIRKP